MLNTTLSAWMTTLRHQLHAHPELALHEVATTKLIEQTLSNLGVRLLDYPGETGVVAEIGHGAPTIALRADIDALPVEETNDLPYASRIPGRMHACGHDFHTASLLGAARLLKAREADLPGTVRLIFQPAEEGHRGARIMIDNGVLTGVQAIAGFHNMPNLPVGTVAMKSGPLMASNDNFDVTIQGQSAHAAMPEASHDPIVTLGELIGNLQTIRSRNIAPGAALVLTIGEIQAGTTYNVIPNTASLKGTIRTFNAANRALAKQRFYEIVNATAKMNQQAATIEWDRGPSCVTNDETITRILKTAFEKDFRLVPAQLCNADDDFALYQERVPGCYGFLGSGGTGVLHQSNYQCDDAGLAYGARFHELAALALLKWAQ